MNIVVADHGGAAAGDGGAAFANNTFNAPFNLTLGQFEPVDPARKQALRSRFEQYIRDYPDQAGYQFALGLSYLDLGLYDLAIEHLKKAIGKGANEANLFYYLALASIKGRRLRTLRLSEVREIESYLQAALALQPGACHFSYLWALIKYDYFLGNGLSSGSPSLEEILHRVSQLQPDQAELRQLARHSNLPPGPFAAELRQLGG